MLPILIVDDEQSMREFLSIMLKRMNLEIETAKTGDEAIEKIGDGGSYRLVITDLRMPGEATGLDVLRHSVGADPACQVVVMTAFATAETALSAIDDGAYDYLTKPFKKDEASVVISRALEKYDLIAENEALKNSLKGPSFQEFIGNSKPMQDVFSLVERVANSNATVLVTGESGTGKELVAQAVHRLSDMNGEFIAINCGAIPENLIEAELFGYKKGAFTGAETDRAGLFEAANGGTLFLDEVGELPLTTQIRLLRALQERKIRRVGDSNEIEIDVRIVAATNRNLLEEVKAGSFREDLYYRLNVIPIELPPLRDRGNDVQLLVEHFIEVFGKNRKGRLSGVSSEAMRALLEYKFPGNVRELQNIIERAVTLESGSEITIESLPKNVSAHGARKDRFSHIEVPPDGLDLDAVLEELERELIEQALSQTNGNRTEAAKLLNVSFRSIRYRLSKFESEE